MFAALRIKSHVQTNARVGLLTDFDKDKGRRPSYVGRGVRGHNNGHKCLLTLAFVGARINIECRQMFNGTLVFTS